MIYLCRLREKTDDISLLLNVFKAEDSKSVLRRLHALSVDWTSDINLLKPTGYVMHQQFNIQQLYGLPTLYLCVLYLSENKLTSSMYNINSLVFITEMKSVYCAVRTGSLNKAVCASSSKG